jgi:competence protein ComEC
MRGEPVLLRLPRWRSSVPAPPIGAIIDVRGRLAQADRTARAARAHAVLRVDAIRDGGRRRGGFVGLVDRVRARAESALGSARLAPAEAGLLRGMVLGQDASMPDDLRDAFRAAGLSHLVAASGANVLLLVALALGLAGVLGLGVRARWALALALIAIYVPLAGGGPSIQRAGIMGGATLVASMASRPASRWYALLLAAAATLALDPRSAGDAGWQLSFAAVAGIAVLTPPLTSRLRAVGLPRIAAESIAVTTAAARATAPNIAWRFDRTSIVSLPVNVLAVPAVAPVMWLGMLAAAVGQVAPGLAAPLVTLAAVPLAYLVWLGRAGASLPGAQASIGPGLVTVASLAAGFMVVRPLRGRASAEGGGARARRRRCAVAATAALGAVVLVAPRLRPSRVQPPATGVLRVTALDVGQGDATLLQAGGHAVLVDAGPPGAGIVAALRRAGVDRLDALVVTHAQADHEGGAPAVLGALPVAVLLDGRQGDGGPLSRALDGPLQRRGTRVVAAQAGEVMRAGPLALRVLWPPAERAAPGADPNDRAIVAEAVAYGDTALLTADAESPVLAPLDLGPVDVLKVSHHGSADEGLGDLLVRTRPRVALVEVGRHNDYGHPVSATMQTLDAAVPVVRRTDRDGTVRVELHGGRATVTTTGSGDHAGV